MSTNLYTYHGLLKVTASGQKAVTLEVPVEQFLEFTTTDLYDAAIRSGYQRPTDPVRAKQISNRLHEKEIVPPVLGNIRDSDMKKVKILDLFGKPATQTGVVQVQIPANVMARLIDGGHRRLGYHFFVERGLSNPNDTVTIFLRLGLSQKDEAEEFMVVNTTAKKTTPTHRDLIGTDLAGKSEARVREELSPAKYKEWKAVRITEGLHEFSPQWDSMIHIADSKNISGRITLSAFRESLKGLIGQPSMITRSVEDIVDILCAYWEAIAEVFPEAFVGEGRDRLKRWALQGGPGVNGFHQMLPMILWKFQATGENPTDKAAYLPLLKRLLDLKGENGRGEEVVGLDFFCKGADGAIGIYSSKVAYPRLAELMFRTISE